jgi:hypothetical protein
MEKICISAISGEYLDLLGEINSSAVRRQSSSEETEVAGMQNIFFVIGENFLRRFWSALKASTIND